jgi:alpha-glucosidase
MTSRSPSYPLRRLAWAVPLAVAAAAASGCDRPREGAGPAASTALVPGPGAAELPADARSDAVSVRSPDGAVEFLVACESAAGPGTPSLKYRVNYRGKPVILDSGLGLELAGERLVLPCNPRHLPAHTGGADETYRVPAGKSNPVRNHYNAATIDYLEAAGRRGRLVLEVRAYDDGVAFRYTVPPQAALRQVQVARERTEFRFSRDAVTYPILLPGFGSPYEDEYQKRLASGLHPGWLIGIPLLAELPGVAWVALAEAHLENYAGMYVRKSPTSPSPYTLEVQLAPRRDRKDLAVIGPMPLSSPWRVVLLGREPGRLIESNLLLNLNPPSAIADPSWIRAGKTAWNWWSGSYAEGVDFTPGMNTATIKHYVDFAAEAGFPYMLIDEGWAVRHGSMQDDDITSVNRALDMPEILRHARSRGVRIWLWSHWIPVDRQMDRAFPLFERWGIAGVKIDFMDRDDQEMVGFYRRALAKAAKHHLMVDFHGAYKPDGIERTYPNLLTREAVMGTEYLKMTARVTPEYDCTLPFTRMLAGPFDYCPGGFHNVTRQEFEPRDLKPMVMGTRAHQLALYVVFQSHLQMVSDYPERYRGERDFAFIRQVPATWDETRVLAGEPMKFIAIARRSGDEWFVGCLTDWDARDLEVPLDFLPPGPGPFVAEIYADAPDAREFPTHTTFRREELGAGPAAALKLHLAPGGGAALRIRREDSGPQPGR